MPIKPLRDQVVIEPTTKEEKRKSGIILPDTAEEKKPEQGKVIAFGPKVKDIKKGDLVLFTQYAPNEVKVNNKDLLVVKAEDILAVIN